MRRPTLLVVLASLFLCLGACGDESTNPAQPDQVSGKTNYILPPGAPEPPSGWETTPIEILESLEYEEFQGTIIPGMGGLLIAEMSTWPGGSYFSINVPPGALPDDGGGSPEPVIFTLRVPTRQMYEDYQYLNNGKGLPLTIQLEPSGILFHEPVEILATYMPWTGATIDWEWDQWGVEPGEEWDGYDLQVEAVKKSVQLQYKLPHFSRWETGGGLPD